MYCELCSVYTFIYIHFALTEGPATTNFFFKLRAFHYLLDCLSIHQEDHPHNLR